MDFIITVAAKDLKIITVEAIKRRLLYLEYDQIIGRVYLDPTTCPFMQLRKRPKPRPVIIVKQALGILPNQRMRHEKKLKSKLPFIKQDEPQREAKTWRIKYADTEGVNQLKPWPLRLGRISKTKHNSSILVVLSIDIYKALPK